MNRAHELARTQLAELAPVLSRTSDLDGTAYDTLGLEGSFLVILAASAATAGTNPTLNVKIQHSDAAAGTYADVTGAAFTEVTTTAGMQMLVLRRDKVKQFIKVIGTLGGTSTPTFAYGVAIGSVQKYE